MNDFTKDELENIIMGVNNLIAIGSCDSSWNYEMKDLKIKLKAMIDNYCEHEAESYPWYSGTYFTGFCKKCGRKCR